MNRYLRKWVFHHLKEQKYILLILTIQFAIASFILNIFFCTSISIKNEYTKMINKQENTRYKISMAYKDKQYFERDSFDLITWGKSKAVPNEYNDLPITKDDLSKLIHDFPKLSWKLIVEIDLITLNEEETIYKIVYDSSIKEAEITEGFYNIVTMLNTADMINLRDFHYSIKSDKIISSDHTEFKINKKPAHSSSDKVEYIALPIEAYYHFFHPKDVSHIMLEMQIPSGTMQESFQDINQGLTYLNHQHGEQFNYRLDNDFAQFLNKVNRAREEAKTFTILSIILLIVISVGISGIFIILLNRQKREISILLSMGITKNQLYAASIIQLGMISAIGGGIGLILGFTLLAKGFQLATVITYPNGIVLAGIFLFLQCISILSSLPMIMKIKNLMPIEFLRSE